MSIRLTDDTAISPEMMERFQASFRSLPQHRVLMNAIKKNGIQSVAMNQEVLVEMQYTFSTELETGEITNQKNSGRCWMFAGLNVLRGHVAKKCQLKSFELSQSYQMFWDKFEKSNYFLESILETLDEPTDGRLISWLLMQPVNDGGQWDMFVNLVEKYGVVPKHVMPETHHSSKSREMNRLITRKLREYAVTLRNAYHAKQLSVESLRAEKQTMLGEIYRILCFFLGEPPKTFDFEYRNEEKEFHRDEHLTPQDFYKKYVDVNLADYVSVIHAPTADKPFGHTYTVQYLGNVKGGKAVKYLNVEMSTFRSLALQQLEAGEPVWFGCDVGQMLDRDAGIMDMNLYDYESALSVPFQMSKEDRLNYGESLMTHAMVFTGVNVVNGQPNRWKVENSWGPEPGNKGFFIMSDEWFDEYMYQIVVRRDYLSAELQAALDTPPVELKPWDPMGSLATLR